MKDEIKEKLLKEIEEFFINEDFDCSVEDFLSKTKKEIEIDLKSIEDFELKSQYVSLKTGYYLAIEETSKAKDEEFIKILTKLEDDMDALQINYANLDECKKIDVYELIGEIKQKIKEKEE